MQRSEFDGQAEAREVTHETADGEIVMWEPGNESANIKAKRWIDLGKAE